MPGNILLDAKSGRVTSSRAPCQKTRPASLPTPVEFPDKGQSRRSRLRHHYWTAMLSDLTLKQRPARREKSWNEITSSTDNFTSSRTLYVHNERTKVRRAKRPLDNTDPPRRNVKSQHRSGRRDFMRCRAHRILARL